MALEHGVGDPLPVDLVGRQWDLRVVEDVQVGLLGGLEVPRLGGGDRVQGELHVLA